MVLHIDGMPPLRPAVIPAKQQRSFAVDRAAINTEQRTCELAFASEAPVQRSWGVEVLDCSSASMRSDRMGRGANVLVDHDARDVVGVIEKIEIGADRVVRALARFGRSVRAEEIWQDVRDGIRRNVSVGYLVHEAAKDGVRDGLDVYRVTDWEPFEVSLVAVPADVSVGVGRGADLPPDAAMSAAAPANDAAPQEAPPEKSPKHEVRSIMTEATTVAAPVAQPAVVAVADKRDHASEIARIAAAITYPQAKDVAMRSIQAGHTVEQFQAELLRAIETKPLPAADIGLTPKETRSYSVVRAIAAMAAPLDAATQRAAAFERECSDAVAAKVGRASRGFFLPYDVQVQQRDLVVGTASAGGNLVATDLLASSFIDRLRDAMVVTGLGARMLTGLQGNVAIPKLSGAATHYWVAENAAPTESQQTLAQVTLSPKTVGAYTDIGRRLTLQASVDVEQMVRDDLAAVLARAIQGAAINGSGASNQPSGLLTLITPGVIGGTNGLAPTWAHIIALETNVAVANADVGTLGYLTNAKVRGKLKGTEKFGSSNGLPIYEQGDTPLNGYRAGITNAVPSNLTKGSSSGICSAILFGNFADLMIGMWGTLDLMVDPFTGSAAGTVRVTALQDVDIAVRNTESFATMVDALTN